MSQDYSALHALAFMYLTMSHQGDGEITEDELLQVRRFVNKYSYESATLRQQGLVAIDDNVTQTLHDVNMWYDRALNEGNEGVFRQFSVLVGQAPKLFFDKEIYPSKFKIFLWDKIFSPITIILDFITRYKFGKNILCIYKKIG